MVEPTEIFDKHAFTWTLCTFLWIYLTVYLNIGNLFGLLVVVILTLLHHLDNDILLKELFGKKRPLPRVFSQPLTMPLHELILYLYTAGTIVFLFGILYNRLIPEEITRNTGWVLLIITTISLFYRLVRSALSYILKILKYKPKLTKYLTKRIRIDKIHLSLSFYAIFLVLLWKYNHTFYNLSNLHFNITFLVISLLTLIYILTIIYKPVLIKNWNWRLRAYYLLLILFAIIFTFSLIFGNPYVLSNSNVEQSIYYNNQKIIGMQTQTFKLTADILLGLDIYQIRTDGNFFWFPITVLKIIGYLLLGDFLTIILFKENGTK